MKKAKGKNNIDFLREIIKGFTVIDSEKAEEAIEFLDAIQNEFWEKGEQIAELKLAAKENEQDDNENDQEYDNSDFVGLDTLNWKLDNGNLKIQQQMESFVQRLQRENSVVPA